MVKELFYTICIRLRSHLALIIIFAIFILATVAGSVIYLNVRQTDQTTSEFSGQVHLQNTPNMQGIIYTAYRKNQKFFTLTADRMWLRSRCVGNARFASFKEMIISHADVMICSQSMTDIMAWARNCNLAPLTATMLVDKTFNNGNSIPQMGLRVVIEDLRIYAESNDGQNSWLVLSADSMIKEPFSDKIVFRGDFWLNFKTGQRLASSEANWLIPQRTFHFPSGYFLDKERKQTGFFTFGKEGVPLHKAEWLPKHEIPVTSGLTAAGSAKRRLLGQSRPFLFADFKKIRKTLKKGDQEAVESLLWQLLVLNPKIFKQAGISPLMMLSPNFQLGAFKPRLFGSGVRHISSKSNQSVSSQQSQTDGDVKAQNQCGLTRTRKWKIYLKEYALPKS